MGALTVTEDEAAPCWERDSVSGARAQRMHSVLLVHGEAVSPSVGPVASPAHLCELLCDLRFWCDQHVVDLHQALDQSFVRYMNDKHHALTSVAS